MISKLWIALYLGALGLAIFLHPLYLLLLMFLVMNWIDINKTMLNNPDNLTAEEMLDYVKDNPLEFEDENYFIFGVDEYSRGIRRFSLYRIVFNRNGDLQMKRDHSWLYSDFSVPDWLIAD